MELQSELWVILQDDEYNRVWNRVDSEFHFNPQFNASLNSMPPPFSFRVPVDIYDISNLPLADDNYYKQMEQIIVNAFIECIGTDDYMYALDWQHSGFRYNPRITTPKPSAFIPDDRYSGGGYNAYFPDFYPDGDYYFFISKDFNWGYLTHPWLEKAWVFGEPLREIFRINLNALKFIPHKKTDIF